MAASLLSWNRKDFFRRCGAKMLIGKKLPVDITVHSVMSFDTPALLAAYSGWSEKPNSRVARSAYRGIAEEDNSHLNWFVAFEFSGSPAKIAKMPLRVHQTVARCCDKAAFVSV